MQRSMSMRPAAKAKPTQYRLHRLRMLLHPMQRSMPMRPAAKEKPTRHRLRRLRMSTRPMQRSMPTQATEQASRMPCRSRDPLKWYRRQAMFPKRMQVLARWCRRAATQQQAKPSAWRQTIERQPAISAIPRRRLYSSGQIVPSTVSKSIPLPARSLSACRRRCRRFCRVRLDGFRCGTRHGRSRRCRHRRKRPGFGTCA
ncbi:hypothetical protein CSX04_03533 [Burkholderia cepacia]|nr:hypothetical protein CSX04_03533 [Burkholderia cepacia]